MAELILPGVYIEVRPEALIVSGPISVGNIGIVGTAAAGTVEKVETIGSYAEAVEKFGPYDAFNASANPPSLTLVRALQIAYDNGASTVKAVRVAKGTPASASRTLASPTGNAAVLTAKAPGTFGNPTKIKIETASDPAKAKVTLTFKSLSEVFEAKDGTELVSQINAGSAIATAAPGSKPGEKPDNLAETAFAPGSDGADATDADYKKGLDKLLNEDAHIIVAAGLDESKIGDELKAHVEAASTDKVKRDRIAVSGSATAPTANTKPTQFSDRLIFVTPGIKISDSAKAADPTISDPSVILPGAYTAAAVAGMLSARDPHISLTNKALTASGLEIKFTSAELEQLVKSQVLAIEERRGFRVVKAITTDNGAFRQITTRRIVDFAKYGVRSAAEPYIGLLNNDRVRKALKGSINGFLAGMVDDEMVVSYELEVTATRDEEIRGIARVTMTVRPTFSIDYIKVVMFLG
jgi:Phage tail sheath protein subtilisin-like domain/Phage tail sheath C-terminal domain